MPARQLLLVVLAVAVAFHHAAGQCLTEPYSGTVEATVNSLPSQQPLCFASLQVSFEGCNVQVTSTVANCAWLQLTGQVTGNAAAATSVLVTGPLSDNAAPSTFILSVKGYWDGVRLEVDGEPQNKADYKVTNGRVFQVKAAFNNNNGADLGGPSGTASTSTANCGSYTGAMRRVAVSRSCPWNKDNACLAAMTVTTSGCSVFIDTDLQGCARFVCRIAAGGSSANCYVDYSTSSLANTNPNGRKMLAGNGLSNAGRQLRQDYGQGAPFICFQAGATIALRQGSCAIFFDVTRGNVMGQGARR